MSERKTAREVAHEAVGGVCLVYGGNHGCICGRLTAAIEARDQEATDRLRIAVEALEAIGEIRHVLPIPFGKGVPMPSLECVACGYAVDVCASWKTCRGFTAREALNRLRSPTAATPAETWVAETWASVERHAAEVKTWPAWKRDSTLMALGYLPAPRHMCDSCNGKRGWASPVRADTWVPCPNCQPSPERKP